MVGPRLAFGGVLRTILNQSGWEIGLFILLKQDVGLAMIIGENCLFVPKKKAGLLDINTQNVKWRALLVVAMRARFITLLYFTIVLVFTSKKYFLRPLDLKVPQKLNGQSKSRKLCPDFHTFDVEETSSESLTIFLTLWKEIDLILRYNQKLPSRRARIGLVKPLDKSKALGLTPTSV